MHCMFDTNKFYLAKSGANNAASVLTYLTNLEVGHHAPLAGDRAGVPVLGHRRAEAVLQRVGQGEGLAVEGDAHHQLTRVGAALHPVFHGVVRVLRSVPSERDAFR